MTTILEKTSNQMMDFGGEAMAHVVGYFVEHFHVVDPMIAIGLSSFVLSYAVLLVVTKIATQFCPIKMALIIMAIEVTDAYIIIDTAERRAIIAETEYLMDLNEIALSVGHGWIFIIAIFSLKLLFSNAYYSNLFNRNNS